MGSKYFITGSKGQLGYEFCKRMEFDGLDYLGMDLDELDISDKGALANVLKDYRPGIIINCAAYNQVDLAESDPGTAFKANDEAVANLAEISNDLNAKFIHYGSDYVFDGKKKNGLYIEEDLASPINKYGESKLAGEKRALEIAESSLVLRLSWVYGKGKQNFIYKFLQWIKNNQCLSIAFDEVSVPTFTGTIVDVTLKAIEKGASGLYQLTNSGYASRYEWAKAILKYKGIDRILYPVGKAVFEAPAARPGFSAMSNKKIVSELNIAIPDWEESLEYYVKKVL